MRQRINRIQFRRIFGGNKTEQHPDKTEIRHYPTTDSVENVVIVCYRACPVQPDVIGMIFVLWWRLFGDIFSGVFQGILKYTLIGRLFQLGGIRRD